MRLWEKERVGEEEENIREKDEEVRQEVKEGMRWGEKEAGEKKTFQPQENTAEGMLDGAFRYC